METSVQICERWILAPLRNQTLVGLTEANREVSRLLEELNDRPFQKLPGCRRSRFEELDRPELSTLPATPCTFAEWRKARVNIDYHIEVERDYYSVPHSLIRKQVDVRLAARTVEVLYGGKRVAVHARSHRVGGFTTDPGHRPKPHQKHVEWSPDRLVRWVRGSAARPARWCSGSSRANPIRSRATAPVSPASSRRTLQR